MTIHESGYFNGRRAAAAELAHTVDGEQLVGGRSENLTEHLRYWHWQEIEALLADLDELARQLSAADVENLARTLHTMFDSIGQAVGASTPPEPPLWTMNGTTGGPLAAAADQPATDVQGEHSGQSGDADAGPATEPIDTTATDEPTSRLEAAVHGNRRKARKATGA